MGTINILDLNNRLTKVEQVNVSQENYNSLKNRPKINGNLLTGDKTSAQLGLAGAADLGALTDLTTTAKTNAVAAINEVVNLLSLHDIGVDYTFADLTAEENITWFTNWTDSVNFPAQYGSGVLIPSKDPSQKAIIYIAIGSTSIGEVFTNVYKNNAWGTWNQVTFNS